MLALTALSAAVALMAASAVGAPAPASPPAASQAVAAAPNPDDKVVCRKFETTGSRLGGYKVCHTMGEWRQITHDAQNELSDSQRRNSQVNGTATMGNGN